MHNVKDLGREERHAPNSTISNVYCQAHILKSSPLRGRIIAPNPEAMLLMPSTMALKKNADSTALNLTM